MGDKKRGQIIVDQPGMAHVVLTEYLVIPFTDVLIHKKLFLVWSLFLFIAFQIVWGVVLGVDAVAQFYFTLAYMALDFHLTHPLMFVVDFAVICIIGGTLWYSRYRYKQKHMTVDERARLMALRRQYGGDVTDE